MLLTEMYYIVNSSDTYRYEILYTELNRLVYRLGLSFQWVIVLTSFYFLILLYKRILEDSSIPEVSVFLLFGECVIFSINQYNTTDTCMCSLCLFYKNISSRKS